jgi:hypothetical protein
MSACSPLFILVSGFEADIWPKFYTVPAPAITVIIIAARFNRFRQEIMAGHSKWANIQHRKGAQDKKRGKLFTKLIREITISARMGGPDRKSVV